MCFSDSSFLKFHLELSEIRQPSGPRRVRSWTSSNQPINQWINESINQSTNQPIKQSTNQINQLSVLGFWSLVPGSWVLLFFWFTGRAYGGAPGGFQGDVPRAVGTHTPLQLRLKIALVFDPVFLRFWLHLGCQDDPQNPWKSLKNHLRKCTPTSKRLRSNFYRCFRRFSTPWGSKNLAKTL